MKIDLKLFDLSIDRIKESIESYIILEATHLIYHVECQVESQPNKEEGEYEVKEKYIHYHGCILKSAVTAVDMDYADENGNYDCWVVEISVAGMATRIKIKVETQSEAQQLFNSLQNYLLNKE